MKVVILLLHFGATFGYHENPNNQKHQIRKNLFEPANAFDAFSGNENPIRSDQGIFFLPAFLPRLRSGENYLDEQELNSERAKRETSGALSILTNHALPIHADVKVDGTADVTEKVTAPETSFYELKSFRKSWPLPNKLELARSISRVITLAVLLISAIVEFFPLLRTLCYSLYSFIYL